MAVPADIGKEERNQEMNEWFRAEIRWAVKSESQEAAFQHALEIGYRVGQFKLTNPASGIIIISVT